MAEDNKEISEIIDYKPPIQNEGDFHSIPIVSDHKRKKSKENEDLTYTWNDSHEKLLKTWGERSHYYSIMHERAGKYYSKWHKWLGLPCKLVLGIVSSVEFAQLSNNPDNGSWSFFFVGFLSLLGLGIELSQEFFDYESRSTKHFLASVVYDKLNMDISVELSYPRNQRIGVKNFLKSVRKVLSDTKNTSPEIPNHILDKYIKEVETAITLSTSISIYEEQTPQKTNCKDTDSPNINNNHSTNNNTSNSKLNPKEGKKQKAKQKANSADLSNKEILQSPRRVITFLRTFEDEVGSEDGSTRNRTSSTPRMVNKKEIAIDVKSEEENKNNETNSNINFNSNPNSNPNRIVGTVNLINMENYESAGISDLQDEFAEEMQKRLKEKQKKFEEFQLNRFSG
jgi:hypothetical protein